MSIESKVKNSNPSDSEILDSLIIGSIQKSDNDRLEKLLNVSPLDKLTAAESDLLLSRYLEFAYENENVESLDVIFDAWKRVYPPDEEMPLLVKLYMNPLFRYEVLEFSTNNYGDLLFEEVINSLINYDASPSISFACKNAIEIFGQQDIEIYIRLYEKSKMSKNGRVTNFLLNLIRTNGEFAEIPTWIIPMPEMGVEVRSASSLVLSISEYLNVVADYDLENNLPSNKQILELLKNKYYGINETNDIENLTPERKDKFDKNIKDLSDKLKDMTKDEKIELLRPVISLELNNDLRDNDDIFKVFGPSNPFSSAEPDEMIWGGERMLIGTSFDYNNDTLEGEDYFNGYCLECNLKIRSRWHSIRMPRYEGGWEGCYCSFICLRKAHLKFKKLTKSKYSDEEPPGSLLGTNIDENIDENINENIDENIDENKNIKLEELVVDKMIDDMEIELQTKGIYDRFDNLNLEQIYQIEEGNLSGIKYDTAEVQN